MRFSCLCTAFVAKARCNRSSFELNAGNPLRAALMVSDVVDECILILCLLEEEYGKDVALAARTSYDVFQIMASHGYARGARTFANGAYKCRVKVQGEDSPETRHMKKFAEDPSSHPAWNMF